MNFPFSLRPRFPCISLGVLLIAQGFSGSRAQAAADPGAAVRILQAHCWECHGPEKQKAGLRLDSREAILKGGDTGPAAAVAAPKKSLLLQTLPEEADPHMPPKSNLPPEDIIRLTEWIAGGLPWADPTRPPRAPVMLGNLPETFQPVLALALAPDGKQLAAGRGAAIVLYSTAEEEPVHLRKMNGHRDAVQSLAWSPDGVTLASAGYQRLVLWDTASGMPRSEWTNDWSGRLTALAWFPDGKTLAVADGAVAEQGRVTLFDVSRGEIVRRWTAHEDLIYGLDVGAQGKRLATGGADQWVRVWRADTGKQEWALEGHTGHVLSTVFSADGEQLLSAGGDKEIKLWDLKTGRKLENNRYEKEFTFTFPTHPQTVTALGWSDDGEGVLSACEDGQLRWTPRLKKQGRRSYTAAGEPLHTLRVSPDGKRIYAGGQSGAIYVWESGGKLVHTLAPGGPATDDSGG